MSCKDLAIYLLLKFAKAHLNTLQESAASHCQAWGNNAKFFAILLIRQQFIVLAGFSKQVERIILYAAIGVLRIG